ncbi:uncharacterized protein [Rutidosis leptorrhynchoides]|uniref:uncharacterized protein n=1 Tax=Rutidosis leptorrhynchoides TaxID=125765 RepID=UPI003A9A1222
MPSCVMVIYSMSQNSVDSSNLFVEKEKLFISSSKFGSSDELLKRVREFYNGRGYGISIRNSKKDKFFTLQCDRGGSYRDVRGIEDKRKKDTATRLVNYPSLPAISRTIYNVKKQIQRETLGNRSEIGALFEELQKENYIWALNAFNEILGHGKQPLVIMSDRELALMNAITSVFPSTINLLCVWHIEKNVVANCKKYFKRAEDFEMFMLSWKNVVYSTTEAIFWNNLAEFESIYNNKKDAIEYIRNTWLPWKEKFVSPWTDKYLHFRNRASSRAEGAHSKLKMYLQNSTSGFQKVKEKFCLAVEHEFNEIKVKLASEKIQVPHCCNIPVYRDILYRVSQFALKEISEQYQKMKKGIMTPCTGHLMATMGLPCAHKMVEFIDLAIPLELIHPQWRIDTFSLNSEVDQHNETEEATKFHNLLEELYSKYQVWPLNKKQSATSVITKLVNESNTYFEPMIHRPKGRPPKSKKKKGKGITSTTRDPSRFEYVESSRSQNPSSVGCFFQRSNEAGDEVSNTDDENIMFGLNLYPDLSSGIFYH